MEWKNKELLEEIYDKAVSGSEYMKQVEIEVSKELKAILSEYKDTLPEQTYMKLEEIVVGGAVAAEKVSFIAGIRYGMRLLKEGLIERKEWL
jgi:hypothetical protein